MMRSFLTIEQACKAKAGERWDPSSHPEKYQMYLGFVEGVAFRIFESLLPTENRDGSIPPSENDGDRKVRIEMTIEEIRKM